MRFAKQTDQWLAASRSINTAIKDHQGISNAAPADAPLRSIPIPKAESDSRHEVAIDGVEARIHDYISNLRFCISPTAFFQVNTLAAEKLYSLAGIWAGLGPDTLLFDICCGTGTIGLTLAHRVGKVVGIEMNASAVLDAERNAEINGIKNCRFVCAKAENVMGSLLKEYLNLPQKQDEIANSSEKNNEEPVYIEEKGTSLDNTPDSVDSASLELENGKSESGCVSSQGLDNQPQNSCTSENNTSTHQFKNVVAIVDPPRVGLHPTDNFVYCPDEFKEVCMRLCRTSWKDHKSKTKSKYWVPFKNDPDIASRVPSNIVPSQWRKLVQYWASKEVQAIAKKNSFNRGFRGPPHTTGRTSFSDIRFNMTHKGERIDKMSLWKRAHNLNDPDVVAIVEEYNVHLWKVPKEQHTIEYCDGIYHKIVGKDGHGYCKTYGRGVPWSAVYARGSGPSQSLAAPSFIDEITQRVTQDVESRFTTTIKNLTARVLFLESQGVAGSMSLREVSDASSGQQASKENE